MEDNANINKIPRFKSLKTVKPLKGINPHTNKAKVKAKMGAKKYKTILNLQFDSQPLPTVPPSTPNKGDSATWHV